MLVLTSNLLQQKLTVSFFKGKRVMAWALNSILNSSPVVSVDSLDANALPGDITGWHWCCMVNTSFQCLHATSVAGKNWLQKMTIRCKTSAWAVIDISIDHVSISILSVDYLENSSPFFLILPLPSPISFLLSPALPSLISHLYHQHPKPKKKT